MLSKATGTPLGEPAPEPAPTAGPRLVEAVKRVLGIRDAAVLVRGHDDLMVYRARCCNPIRGDEIVGYVTRGRGVAVHNKNCPNVQKLLYEAERRIPVEWTASADATFPVRLLIRAKDRPGLLANVTSEISNSGSNIRTLGTRTENLQAIIEVFLEIADRKQLERLFASLRKISGVLDVERHYRV